MTAFPIIETIHCDVTYRYYDHRSRLRGTPSGFSSFIRLSPSFTFVNLSAGNSRQFSSKRGNPTMKNLSDKKSSLVNEVMWINGKFKREELKRLSVGSLEILLEAVTKAESVVNRAK